MQLHPQGAPCPVCRTATQLYDVVDFNKSCIESSGRFLPLAGWPIYYAICPECGFCFAPEMWALDEAAFRRYVYNDAYGLVDPDYLEHRPDSNAQMLLRLFKTLGGVRHLDYGGGNGRMSSKLAEAGVDSRSYDPFVTGYASRPAEAFDLITVFEVFEHVPSVDRLMQDLVALTHDQSLVLFSTELSDSHIRGDGRLTWWYAAPRNGHISLYSRQSLIELGGRHGFAFVSFGDNLHMYMRRTVPAWAQDAVKLT